jgi:hypothetical protein
MRILRSEVRQSLKASRVSEFGSDPKIFFQAKRQQRQEIELFAGQNFWAIRINREKGE